MIALLRLIGVVNPAPAIHATQALSRSCRCRIARHQSMSARVASDLDHQRVAVWSICGDFELHETRTAILRRLGAA